MNSRERILSRIKDALQAPAANPVAKPIFTHTPFKPLGDEPLEVVFAKRFQENGGTFFFCQTLEDFLVMLKKWLAYQKINVLFSPESYLQQLLQIGWIDFELDDVNWRDMQASILLADSLVAETGSILLASERNNGRRLITFPPVQIVVAFTSQITPTLTEALQSYQTKYETETLPTMLTVISTPSQTADIERVLVMGAHGPEKLVLFLIDEEVL